MTLIGTQTTNNQDAFKAVTSSSFTPSYPAPARIGDDRVLATTHPTTTTVATGTQGGSVSVYES